MFASTSHLSLVPFCWRFSLYTLIRDLFFYKYLKLQQVGTTFLQSIFPTLENLLPTPRIVNMMLM